MKRCISFVFIKIPLIPLMTLSLTDATVLKVKFFFSHRNTNSPSVMIGYLGRNEIKVSKIKNQNQGRILIVDADIDKETFVPINLYNTNTETEQFKLFMSSISY